MGGDTRRSLALSAVGIGAGLAAAVGLSRLLVAMLYEVTPSDGATLMGAVALIFGVDTVAAGIPARASARTDPVVALRADG